MRKEKVMGKMWNARKYFKRTHPNSHRVAVNQSGGRERERERERDPCKGRKYGDTHKEDKPQREHKPMIFYIIKL